MIGFLIHKEKALGAEDLLMMILNDGKELVENMKKKGEIGRSGHEMVSVIIRK